MFGCRAVDSVLLSVSEIGIQFDKSSLRIGTQAELAIQLGVSAAVYLSEPSTISTRGSCFIVAVVPYVVSIETAPGCTLARHARLPKRFADERVALTTLNPWSPHLSAFIPPCASNLSYLGPLIFAYILWSDVDTAHLVPHVLQ